MYYSFCEFLENYGFTEDEIFDAFMALCDSLDLWLHEAIVEGNTPTLQPDNTRQMRKNLFDAELSKFWQRADSILN